MTIWDYCDNEERCVVVRMEPHRVSSNICMGNGGRGAEEQQSL